MTCLITINSKALIRNIQQFRDLIAYKKIKLGAVVKSNAYGHGIESVVPVIKDHADLMLVFSLDELRLLRKLYSGRVIMLGPVTAKLDGGTNDIVECLKLKSELSIGSFEQLVILNAICKSLNYSCKVHIFMDVLFGRRGFLCSQTGEVINQLRKSKNITLTGVCAHLSCPASKEGETQTSKQLNIANSIFDTFATSGLGEIEFHIAASGGVVKLIASNNHQFLNRTKIVRIGGGIYGLWVDPYSKTIINNLKLTPVLELRSRITRTYVKEEIAEVGIGFTHGFLEAQTAPHKVIVNGKYHSVKKLSRNSMLISIKNSRDYKEKREINKSGKVSVGDSVTLIGSNCGVSITSNEVADIVGTINYEIVTALSPKITRKVI